MATYKTYPLESDSPAIGDGILKIINKLSDERSFWKKILTAVHEPLFIVDENKNIVFYNKKAEEITGFSHEEVVGKPCLVGIRCNNCLLECALFKEGQVKFRNLEFVTKAGKIIKVVKNAEVFYDENGNIIGGVETFRDVTKEREQADQIEKEKNTIERILDNIGDGVVALGVNKEIIFANERIESVTGYKAEQLIGKSINSILDHDLCNVLSDPGMTEGISTTIKSPDGTESAVYVTVLSKSSENCDDIILLFRKITPVERVKQQLKIQQSYHGIVSNSSTMIEIFNMIESIKDSDVPIMIEGASGTGKEKLARAIHESSSRRDKPFHTVNCAVLDEEMLESELFGHIKGAVTGAISEKIGRFELADGGTIYFDEIGNLSAKLQIKLLRYLQNNEFERVGEIRTRKSHVRIIASSNNSLAKMVESGSFRDDLYYRLNVIPIQLPPLRDRMDDIPLLVDNFIIEYCAKKNIPLVGISDDAMLILKRHRWSGNVRELENVLLNALSCCERNKITVANLPRQLRVPRAASDTPQKISVPTDTVDEAEKNAILDALRENSFNRTQAAEQLGITRTTLWRKIKKYKLQH